MRVSKHLFFKKSKKINHKSLLEIAKQMLNCVPWYLPPSFDADILPCDPGKTVEFLDSFEEMLKLRLNEFCLKIRFLAY